jgi:hypothetical protein
VGNRKLFQLLAEDDTPMMLEPNETRTISYDILLPQEHVHLDSTKNVEVHIAYTDETEAPSIAAAQGQQAPDSGSFCIKLESGEVVAEAFLLEDLLAAVKSSHDEAIGFHLKDGNDFAVWVKNVVGDSDLADRLASVQSQDPAAAKKELLALLDSKVESLKHPFLRKVSPQTGFVLKSDHDKVLSEIHMLEQLADALSASASDTVSFHTRQGNDFAAWIQHSVGDAELAAKISGIDYSNPDSAKNQLVSAILERVDSLKC